jgi:hypothetical protein
MKVLINQHKGFVKYLPITKGRYQYDFDIDEKIMPRKLLKKVKTHALKRMTKNGVTVITELPIGFSKEAFRESGYEIITMTKEQYESVKDELVTP